MSLEKKHFHVIANPRARHGRSQKELSHTVDYLRQRQIETTVHYTNCPRHGIKLAESLVRQGVTQLVSAGGDGTAFEVINGIMRSGQAENVVLGILPLGTGNAFLMDFGITTLEQALERLTSGRSQWIDIAQAKTEQAKTEQAKTEQAKTEQAKTEQAKTEQAKTEQETLYFHNMMGFGFIAQACRAHNQRFCRLGRWSYHAAAVYCLLGLRSQTVALQIDGGPVKTLSAPIFALCNSQYTGYRMRLSPESSVHDGRLDWLVSEPLGVGHTLGLFKKLPQGGHLQDPSVHHTSVRQIKIELPRLQNVMVDGEILSLRQVEVVVLPQAVNLMV